MESEIDVLRQISKAASRALQREIDPLMAARQIDGSATSIGLGLKEPFKTLKGIVSQADDIPDPDQLRLWSPTVAAAKQQQRTSFLEQFGEQILRACADIQALLSRDGR